MPQGGTAAGTGVVGIALAGWVGAAVATGIVLAWRRSRPGAAGRRAHRVTVVLAALLRGVAPLPGRPALSDAVARLLVAAAVLVVVAVAADQDARTGRATNG